MNDVLFARSFVVPGLLPSLLTLLERHLGPAHLMRGCVPLSFSSLTVTHVAGRGQPECCLSCPSHSQRYGNLLCACTMICVFGL